MGVKLPSIGNSDQKILAPLGGNIPPIGGIYYLHDFLQAGLASL